VKNLPEPLREAGRKAIAAGWKITRTNRGHLKWQPPAGCFIITGSTPGGGKRSTANALADMKRAGLDV
jgi:hypothetical protein